MDIVTLDGSKIDFPVEEQKIKKISLFDFVSDITNDKSYILSEQTEKEYVPFMINRALSQNLDTVMLANEMNKLACGDKLMSHDFFFYTVTKKKRYGKWAKAVSENAETIELLMKHYAVNRKVAMDYLKCLTDDDIKQLVERYNTGGKTK